MTKKSLFDAGVARTAARSSNSATVTKTVGKGRGVSIVSYEIDPRDIEDILRGKRHAPRPPVSVTYYKPTRAQHYAALGRMYGVKPKLGQSLRAYAREVDKAVASACASAAKRKGERLK